MYAACFLACVCSDAYAARAHLDSEVQNAGLHTKRQISLASDGICRGQSREQLLQSVLRDGKQRLEQIVKQPEAIVRVVMGNEAADLDSMTSALVLAAWQSAEHGMPVFPVFNAPRAEMRLRKDNLEALRLAGVQEAAILCVDEIPLEELSQQGRLKLTLVDHNELSPRQAALTNSVVGIVDHHFDAGLYKQTVHPSNRSVVFPIGSTCSIITEMLLSKSSPLLRDCAANMLLASSIIVDTRNLQDEAKTTPRDQQALIFLEKSFGADRVVFGGAISFEPWLQRLDALRDDTQGFSLLDLLRKDLKYARGGSELFAVAMLRGTLGMLTDGGKFTEEQAFLESMAAFLHKEPSVGTLFTMLWGRTTSTRDVISCTSAKRELEPRLQQGFARLGNMYGGKELRGAPGIWTAGPRSSGAAHVLRYDHLHCAVWEIDQGRKQLMPFLQDFFEALP